MAATNGTFDAGPWILYVEGVAVAYITDMSAGWTHTPRQVKSKTNGRWTVNKQGTYEVSGSCNVLYAQLSAAGASIYNLQDVVTHMLAGTQVTLQLTNDNAGDYDMGGEAQFTAVNVTYGPYGETATGDFSFINSDSWDMSIIT